MTNNKKTQDRDDDLDFQEEKISIVETSDGVRKEGGRDFSSIWSRRTRAAPFIRCIMLRAIVLNPRHSYGTPCSLEHRATSRELAGLSFIPPNSNK